MLCALRKERTRYGKKKKEKRKKKPQRSQSGLVGMKGYLKVGLAQTGGRDPPRGRVTNFRGRKQYSNFYKKV